MADGTIRGTVIDRSEQLVGSLLPLFDSQADPAQVNNPF